MSAITTRMRADGTGRTKISAGKGERTAATKRTGTIGPVDASRTPRKEGKKASIKKELLIGRAITPRKNGEKGPMDIVP